MAATRSFWFCLFSLLLVTLSKSESRRLVPVQLSNPRRNPNATVLTRELLEESKALKAGLNGLGTSSPGSYDLKRQSPSGPDPQHHSMDLQWSTCTGIMKPRVMVGPGVIKALFNQLSHLYEYSGGKICGREMRGFSFFGTCICNFVGVTSQRLASFFLFLWIYGMT